VCKGWDVHVGILGGTGPLGRGLALRLAATGHRVTVGSRDKERCEEMVASLLGTWPGRDLDIVAAANETAAAAEVVVVATPWDSIVSTAQQLSDELAGKVVVSVANALVRQGKTISALTAARGSIAATLQAAVPDIKVAAACHHLPAGTLADLDATLEADVLVCSDHSDATAATCALLAGIDGLRPLDAGSLESAGAIEAFTAVLVTLNIRYKAHSTLRLGGIGPSSTAGAPPR
jgi:8-hydroxy-5-deazaflavin:NADPH oxidoreductase